MSLTIQAKSIGATCPLLADIIAERGGFRQTFDIAPFLEAEDAKDLIRVVADGWCQSNDGDLLMEALHLADTAEVPAVCSFLSSMHGLIQAQVDGVFWRVEIKPEAGMRWLHACRPDVVAQIQG
jgi:hypothetical protein